MSINHEIYLPVFFGLSIIYFGLWIIFFKNHLSEEKKAEIERFEKGSFSDWMLHRQYMLKPGVLDDIGKKYFPVYCVTVIAWVAVFFLIVSGIPAAK